MLERVDVDAVVIGAGAVGLACGAKLVEAGISTVVLEAGATHGSGNSSRNSEVIHVGLYYPFGSLKHRLCIRGQDLLYRHLQERGIAHRRCGKIVVACSQDELASIEGLYERARRNDVKDATLIGMAALRECEPDVKGVGGLLSASTGIFDSHSYMSGLVMEIEGGGGIVACHSPVEHVSVEPHGFDVIVGGKQGFAVSGRILVNSAGLHAQTVAQAIDGLDPDTIPPLFMAKGSYFRLRGKSPFGRLVYPAPTNGGLGIHATIDLSGGTRFGPDVEWLEAGTSPSQVDYAVDDRRKTTFEDAIRRYWPNLPADALQPDYSGCRPKLSGPAATAADFMIQTEARHGIRGLVNLYGLESPGLTSSLAVAEYVLQQLQAAGDA